MSQGKQRWDEIWALIIGALMKLLYLVQQEITSKWKRPIHNCNRRCTK